MTQTMSADDKTAPPHPASASAFVARDHLIHPTVLAPKPSRPQAPGASVKGERWCVGRFRLDRVLSGAICSEGPVPASASRRPVGCWALEEGNQVAAIFNNTKSRSAVEDQTRVGAAALTCSANTCTMPSTDTESERRTASDVSEAVILKRQGELEAAAERYEVGSTLAHLCMGTWTWFTEYWMLSAASPPPRALLKRLP